MQNHYRIKSKKDFAKIYRRGQSIANFQFVLYWLEQKRYSHFRLGVSVSKKLGNAVVRNRMRRLVKEIVRLNSQFITESHDFIIIVRKSAIVMEYKDLEKSLLHVFRKAGFVSSFQKKDHL